MTSRYSNHKPHPLVVGIGSAHGDDQAGWFVARQLADLYADNIQVYKTSVPLDLLNWIDETSELHIVDACNGDGSPGHLYRWDWSDLHEDELSLNDHFVLRGSGTHDFDVLSVLQLARQLGRFPQSVTIWGIQGEQFSEAESISPSVAVHLADIVGVIEKELTDARAINGAVPADAG